MDGARPGKPCCPLYTEGMDQQLKQIIEEAERRQSDPELRAAMRLGEIYPTNIVPILTHQGPELMKWGYSGYKNRIINARSETAMDKAMFRRSLMERRCLVPASGYYEWQRTRGGSKSGEKYAFYHPGKPLYMAGLWRMEQNGRLPVFVILTRQAAPGLSGIHDRMPVILPEETKELWLSQDADAGLLMKHPFTDLTFRAVSV